MSNPQFRKSGFQNLSSTLEFRIPRDKEGRIHIDWAGLIGKNILLLLKTTVIILTAGISSKAALIMLLSTIVDTSAGFFTDGRKRGSKTRTDDSISK